MASNTSSDLPHGPEPRLRREERGFFIEYRGRDIYQGRATARRTERELQRLADHTDLRETLIICPSPLLAEGILSVLEDLPESSFLLGLEADSSLHRLTRDHIPSGLQDHPRFSLLDISREPRRTLQGWLRSLGSFLPWRRIRRISPTRGCRLYPRIYQEAEALLQEEIQNHWRNRLTQIHLGRLWISNLIQNLSALPRHSPLPGAAGEQPPERPVVVLGAGESLEGNLSRLQTARDRGWYLLAVDTALPCLTAAGLPPDGVIALEAQQANQDDFLLPLPSRRSPSHPRKPGYPFGRLYSDITSYAALNRPASYEQTFFLTPFASLPLLERLQREFPRLPRLPAAGSVGISALALGLQLTSGPVFHTGLDFSYRHGKTHSRDTPFLLRDLRTSSRTQPPGSRMVSLTADRYRTVLGPAPSGPPSSRLLTDPSLQLYARMMKQLVQREQRIFPLEDPQTVKTEPPPPPAPGEQPAGAPAAHPNPNRIRAFLAGEEDRLARLLHAISPVKPIPEEKKTGGIPLDPPAQLLLHEANYLFCYFPDAHRGTENPLPRDFTNRLIPVIRHFRQAWQRSAERL